MPQADIVLDSNVAEILRHFEALPQGLQQAARAGLGQGLAVIRGQVQRNITDTFEHTSAGGMRQAVTSSVDEEDGLQGRLSVDKHYAAIHEFGGTIVPTEKKALTVPVAPEAYGKRAADFRDLKLIPRKGKPALLALEIGTQSRIRQVASDVKTRRAIYGVRRPAEVKAIKVLFVLVKSVTMPARPFFFPAINEKLDAVPKGIRQQIDAFLKSKEFNS